MMNRESGPAVRTTAWIRQKNSDRRAHLEIEAHGDETHVRITDQLVTFIGQSMIDGSRNGRRKALDQHDEFLKGARNDSYSERSSAR